MLTTTLFFAILLPQILATTSPTHTAAPDPQLVDRQVSSVTTLFGTCHTSTPTNNVPRGICTITSPTDTPFTRLGCNNGILDGLRLLNCTSDGSVGA
jgi:hypothetical protein